MIFTFSSLIQEPILKTLYRVDKNVDWRLAVYRTEVRVFGKIVSERYVLKKKDLVSYSKDFYGKEPEVNRDYQILFEDKKILALSKPANLPMHPCGAYKFHTLTKILEADGHQLKSVHRIDKETSGVLIFVRQSHDAKWMANAIENGLKHYSALVHGKTPAKFMCNISLGKDKDSLIGKKMGRDDDGKTALTYFEREEYFSRSNMTLLNVQPKTGRTHQIRAHLSIMGYPVVGDKIYGKDESYFIKYLEEGNSSELELLTDGISRQFLHCNEVNILHPWTGERLSIKSPLPQELEAYLAVLE